MDLMKAPRSNVEPLCRYQPARELVETWTDGDTATSIVRRLGLELDVDHLTRLLWLYPHDRMTNRRADLLEAVAEDTGVRLSTVRRRVVREAQADEKIEIDRLDGLDRLLVLHDRIRRGVALDNASRADLERALTREAHRQDDRFFSFMARLERFSRLQEAESDVGGQFDRLLGRLRRVAARSPGFDVLEPIVQLRAVTSGGAGDMQTVLALIDLASDRRLVRAHRDAAIRHATRALSEGHLTISSLAVRLERVLEFDLSTDPIVKGERMTELATGLYLVGELDAADRHIQNARRFFGTAETPPRLSVTSSALLALINACQGHLEAAREALAEAEAEARELPPGGEDELILVLARLKILSAANRQPKAIELAETTLRESAQVSPNCNPGPWEALLARERLRLLHESAASDDRIIAAAHDCIVHATRARDLEAERDAYFTLAQIYAGTPDRSDDALEACHQAKRLTELMLDALSADRDLLVKLLPRDSALRTVLSSVINRSVHDVAQNLETLFRLVSVVVEQAQRGQDLIDELRHSKIRMDRILKSLPVIIWTCHGGARGFKAAHIDGAVKRVYGRDSDEVLRTPTLWLDLIHDSDRNKVLASLARVERQLDHDTVQFRIAPKDGEERWVEMRALPLLGDEEGALYGILTDITARRQLEEALQRARSSDVTARLAEDFNGILTGILSATNNLANAIGADKASTTQRYLEVIETLAEKGTRTASWIRTFAALNHGVVDVAVIARESVELARRQVDSPVEVVFEGPHQGIGARVDQARITQALLNLVKNAAEAGPHHGPIVVEVRGGSPGNAFVTVTDSGCGMDADVQLQAFDAYFSTKTEFGEERKGLGLTAVYRTVRDFGGEVEIDSRVGEGTTITLQLPSAALPHTPSRPEPAPVNTGRTLLIDDDQGSLDVAKMFLERAGFEVVTAKDGAAGLEIFETEPSNWSLIITDVRMPKCNGVEVVNRVREQAGPQPPIILMTGFADELPDDFAKARQNLALVRKPFTYSGFVELVTSLTVGEED